MAFAERERERERVRRGGGTISGLYGSVSGILFLQNGGGDTPQQQADALNTNNSVGNALKSNVYAARK